VTALRKLFEPIKVGRVDLKNRLVMAPVTDNYAVDYYVTERMVDFYAERAKGGTGLITIGYFTPNIPSNSRGLGLFDDRFIPGLRRLTDAIHAAGAKVEIQLGLEEHMTWSEGGPFELVGPSNVIKRFKPGAAAPRPLTIEEIEQLVDEFGEAVRRAREGGFDSVQFLGSAGYILAQFISPLTNRRTDRYGGSLENRTRLFLEIIESSRKKAGRDFTLTARLSGEQFMDGGYTLEETKDVAILLERAGIDAINVTTGWHDSPQPFIVASVSRGKWVYLAKAVKQVVNVPVITGTRIVDPRAAEEILVEGKADMVYMARPLIADPELPNKARKGQFDEIVPCTACCLCYDRWAEGAPIVCQVNARAGREAEYTIEPARKPKEVFIIGGGPAGMEAARVAAVRGHKVTLFEKEDRLGGKLHLVAAPPHKEEFASFTEYLIGQMKKVGVQVQLGHEATVHTIEDSKPDVVILAIGATTRIPDVPGAQGSNVATAEDALTGRRRIGEKVIILGGGLVGCETAEFLAQQGKRVVIVTSRGKVATDVGPTNKWVIRKRLAEAGISIENEAKIEEITDKGVRVSRGGQATFLEGDTVVLAQGFQLNSKLAEELEGKADSLHRTTDLSPGFPFQTAGWVFVRDTRPFY